MRVKLAQGGEGEGCTVHAYPLSLHLPSPVKLPCTLKLSGQIHWPCFISSKNGNHFLGIVCHEKLKIFERSFIFSILGWIENWLRPPPFVSHKIKRFFHYEIYFQEQKFSKLLKFKVFFSHAKRYIFLDDKNNVSSWKHWSQMNIFTNKHVPKFKFFVLFHFHSRLSILLKILKGLIWMEDGSGTIGLLVLTI